MVQAKPAHSANFSGGRNGEVLKLNPPGDPGFLRLYEVILLGLVTAR
jgi:hypothetical protein